MDHRSTGLLVDSFADIVPIEDDMPVGGYAQALADEMRLLDAGSIDVIIVLDTFGRSWPGLNEKKSRLDPFVVTPFLAMQTERLRFALGAPVELLEPFSISKVYQTLDHVSGGRLGFCVSTVMNLTAHAALTRPHPGVITDPEGYLREFVEVVHGLWNTWEPGALLRDAATGRYLDPDLVHHLHHAGEHFQVRGPSLTPWSPQGRPPTILHTTSASVPAGLWEGVLTDAADAASLRMLVGDHGEVSLVDARSGGYAAARSALIAPDADRPRSTLRDLLGLGPAINPHSADDSAVQEDRTVTA